MDEQLDPPSRRHDVWAREPDFVEFYEQQFRCLIKRSEVSGAYCGYVLVSPNHPLYGLDSDNDMIDALCVHGGVTFAGKHEFSSTAWTIGFDCAHGGDLAPRLLDARERLFARLGKCTPAYDAAVYRDLSYVACETRDLAKQIAEVGDAVQGV